jgi:hypothetical protein
MAMIKCKECGNSVSSKAITCPSCGVVLKKPQKKISCLSSIIIIVIACVVIIMLTETKEEKARKIKKMSMGSHAENGIPDIIKNSINKTLGDKQNKPRVKEIQIKGKAVLVSYRTYMKLDGNSTKLAVIYQTQGIIELLSTHSKLRGIQSFTIYAYQQFYNEESEEVIMKIKLSREAVKNIDWDNFTPKQLLSLSNTKGKVWWHSRFNK